MNAKIKIGAYAVLALLVLLFGWCFYAKYSDVSRAAVDTGDAAPPATNAPAVAGATNGAPAPAAPAPARGQKESMVVYLAAFVASAVGLGLLIAYDVSQFVGEKGVDFLLDAGGAGERDPEYEKAEQAWANGEFLEAIRLMREFLNARPRDQYAALRIAEIYEKDLNNPLAAALEYEEILKKKLPPERWGWSAIHLCNLYSKLGQQDKTRALLQRIVDEYPKTGAAKKARSRLGLAEPEPESAPAEEPEQTPDADEASAPTPAPAPAEPAPKPVSKGPIRVEPPKPKLPPGFRQK